MDEPGRIDGIIDGAIRGIPGTAGNEFYAEIARRLLIGRTQVFAPVARLPPLRPAGKRLALGSPSGNDPRTTPELGAVVRCPRFKPRGDGEPMRDDQASGAGGQTANHDSAWDRFLES